MEERSSIEEGFLGRQLLVLYATQTLGAGLNSPCNDVIMTLKAHGSSYITPQSYKQMTGRAGRGGHNSVQRQGGSTPVARTFLIASTCK